MPPAIVDPKVWEPHFPFPECRPTQAQILDFLVKRLLEGVADILVEAPTGIGKSLIAMAIALWLASQGSRTYISTTTVELEDQYIKDFYQLGLRQLHSKDRYPCDEFRRCNLGAASQCQSKECAYKLAKSAFLSSSISICNSAYLLTSARFVKNWVTRDLVIFDEAHALHETIASKYSIQIPARGMRQMPNEGEERDWLQDYYAPHLSDQINDLEEQLHDTDQDNPRLEQLVERLKTANRELHNIETLVSDNLSEWVFDHQPTGLTILPLWAKRFAQELLPRIGRKRIYLSATLAGAERQMRFLGINPGRAAFLSLPSPFPVRNRPVHMLPHVSWPKGGGDIGPTITRLCKILPRILQRHPEERGIVFVSSYVQAQAIVAEMCEPRLLTHEGPRDKSEVMAQFHRTPGAVLVSATCHEGLDLYDDLSRFQVIAKMPFASMGDKRTQRRVETDPRWYALHTAQKLVQACGRSVRSAEDYATTYILDAAFRDYFFWSPLSGYRRKDWWKDQLLPEYFKASLTEGFRL